jgi:hypothetical protein
MARELFLSFLEKFDVQAVQGDDFECGNSFARHICGESGRSLTNPQSNAAADRDESSHPPLLDAAPGT